jgi:hypothetical protein
LLEDSCLFFRRGGRGKLVVDKSGTEGGFVDSDGCIVDGLMADERAFERQSGFRMNPDDLRFADAGAFACLLINAMFDHVVYSEDVSCHSSSSMCFSFAIHSVTVI